MSARRGLPPVPSVAAPADKRFRRSDVRPERRRRASHVWRLARWATVCLLLAATVVWLSRVVLTSPWLRVRNIVVRGNTHLSSEEVGGLLEGTRDKNVFEVNFDDYRRRVMDSPWVSQVTLWRVLPSTVEVRVAERVPMVVARLGPQLYLVDDAGAIIDEYGPQYREFDLPIVDGLLTAPVAGVRPVSADRVRLTMDLLAAVETRADLKRHLSQVDVSDARDAVVMFDTTPVWLHLGDTRFIERLKMYLELEPTLQDRFRDIDYVDLRFDERVFVKPRVKSHTGDHGGK
jgi:cell division septal protein FtsQ